jgi:catechol 2,3-dioxygenase-like lactoylglutathione lyase family enzyme
MLGDHSNDVVLLATDLEESKDFYAGKLGLEILNESEEAITCKCGGDSRLGVTKAVEGVADLGFAPMAWIADPHRNALAILQLR